MINHGMGRRVPKDFKHITKYPFSLVLETVTKNVEKELILPSWHKQHDQRSEGACVSFASAMAMSIINEDQCRQQGQIDPYIRYNPWKAWRKAKAIDEWPETKPEDDNGTSVRAVGEILQTVGNVLWTNEDDTQLKETDKWSLSYGIKAYRWATRIDEIRSEIDLGRPIILGINWYSNFVEPIYENNEYWIGQNSSKLGILIGGHSVCIYGASDVRQAVKIKNSWGEAYPEVWMPYETLDRLLRENGEAMMVTDY